MTRPSEYEEWRLAFELPESRHSPDMFIERIRPQVHPDVAIHRHGRRGIRLYAGTRQQIEYAAEIIRHRLEAWRLQATLELTRWNPGGERWQEPSLAVEPARPPLPDPWAEFDELAWEVRLRFENELEAAAVVDELREQGVAVLEGWRRCLIALPDELTARKRAEELQLAAPRADIQVRPLSRFRRWMISQRVLDNYSGSFDARVGGSGPTA